MRREHVVLLAKSASTGEPTPVLCDEDGYVYTTPAPAQAASNGFTAGAPGTSLQGVRLASPVGDGTPAVEAMAVVPAVEYKRVVGTQRTSTVSSVQRVAGVEHIGKQTLPLAGAELPVDFYEVPAGCSGVTFLVTYSRGAVQGYASVRFEQANGVGTGTKAGRELVVTSTSIAGVQNTAEQIVDLPKPPDATARTWAISFAVGFGVTHVRLVPWESGAVATPGLFDATIVAGSR